ncbi:MAG: helix-turn-helix domain-containing protein [Planctomycetaceae bacterium]
MEAEKPQLVQKGLAILAAHKARQARLKTAVEALRVAREELGISLTELQRRTGINRSNLSRLENAPDPNPTIDTLNRYARAVGKEIIISLADRDEQGSPSEV